MVVAIAFPLLFGGCYNWRVTTLGAQSISDVRLTTSAGQTRYSAAMMEGDSVIAAATDSAIVRIPVDSVELVEREDFDFLTTVGVGVIVITAWICIYPGC
jgi:hypothetical protein